MVLERMLLAAMQPAARLEARENTHTETETPESEHASGKLLFAQLVMARLLALWQADQLAYKLSSYMVGPLSAAALGKRSS